MTLGLRKAKGMIASTVIGVAIGMAIGSGAAHGRTWAMFWPNTGTHLMTDVMTMGYVEGAHDMLAELAYITPQLSKDDPGWVTRQYLCLDAKAPEPTELAAWAKYHWLLDQKTRPGQGAAESLLLDACQ